MVDTPRRLSETFWRRHSNPKSGWSRTVTTPALLYAIYRRDPRLLVAVLGFAALNPLLFSPPETDDAWMTRVVLAERWWTEEEGRGVLDLSYPNVLNLLNVPVTGYALVAAYRRRAVRSAVAGAASMALKFWYVGALVRRYDARASDATGASKSRA
jgi:hypothetical protein